MNFTSSKNKLVLKDRLFVSLRFGFRAFLPIFVFVMVVFLKLTLLAYALVLLSKWRVVATKPRFWWLNLQPHLVDLIFALSVVYFMAWPDLVLAYQLLWLAIYFVWIFVFRIWGTPWNQMLQGVVAQGLGMSFLIYHLDRIHPAFMVAIAWVIGISAARHILSGFKKEVYHGSLIHIWGLFVAQLTWVFLHWHINFWIIPPLVFLQVVFLATFSLLYALHRQDSLPKFFIRQVIISLLILTIVTLILSSIQVISL